MVKNTLLALGLGQFFSLLVTFAGFTSSQLANKVITAYGYTSITNVILVDYLTIPCVLLLSSLFLKRRYGFRKLVGIAICVAGLVTLVYSDIHSPDGSSGIPLKGRGDLLTIVGAVLYAIIYVSEEVIFKTTDRVELMASLGIYGVLACHYQMYPPFEKIYR